MKLEMKVENKADLIELKRQFLAWNSQSDNKISKELVPFTGKQIQKPKGKAFYVPEVPNPVLPVDRKSQTVFKTPGQQVLPTIQIAKSFRGYPLALCMFFGFLAFCLIISREFSWLTLNMDLSWTKLPIGIHLPLASLPAFLLLMRLLMSVYGGYLELQPAHLKLVSGRFSQKAIHTEVPYDSIFFVEVHQNYLDHIFNTGTIAVGRNSGSKAELQIKAVKSPYSVSEIIKNRITDTHKTFDSSIMFN